MQAQLATAPGDVFSREQAKILADYERTLEKINEEATKYANKKGVSTEQANQLKKQKEIEAGLKRDLDLRQAQEKEEKRLVGELARVNGMLSNEKFLSKAPESKIAEEKGKLEKYTQMMEQVRERLAALK